MIGGRNYCAKWEFSFVIPAEAGIQCGGDDVPKQPWIPAYAGMTVVDTLGKEFRDGFAIKISPAMANHRRAPVFGAAIQTARAFAAPFTDAGGKPAYEIVRKIQVPPC